VVFSITSLSVLSAPQNAFAGSSVETTIIPYLDTNYKFKVVNQGGLAGFEQPTFDDSSFSTGDAGFGTVNAICSLTNSVNTKTVWPLNTDILLRKNFNLPAGATNLRIFVAIDNDIQVFVNGADVSGGLIMHGGCPTRDSFMFTAPDITLNEGENLLSVRARDRGSVSYVDVRVVFDVGEVNLPPVALAGPLQFGIPLGSLVELDGTGSFDPEGAELTYQWQNVGCQLGDFTFFDPTSPEPSFIPTGQCNAITPFEFELTVSDDVHNSLVDTTFVRVLTAEQLLQILRLERADIEFDNLKDELKLSHWNSKAFVANEKGKANQVDKFMQKYIDTVTRFVGQDKISFEDGLKLINRALQVQIAAF